MKKLFMIVLSVLLVIGVYRVSVGNESLGILDLMGNLNLIDVDFSTLESVFNLAQDYINITLVDVFTSAWTLSNFFEKLGQVFYVVLIPIQVIIAIIQDILITAYSLIRFVFAVLGLTA